MGWQPWTDRVGHMLSNGRKIGLEVVLDHFESYEEASLHKETLNMITGEIGSWLENKTVKLVLR